MKNFWVKLTVTVERVVFIEADSAEDAASKAADGEGVVESNTDCETQVDEVEED